MGSTTITPLYERKSTPMYVAGFGSGTGSNLVRLLENQERLALLRGRHLYKFAAIVTDNENEGNNARAIAGRFMVEFFLEDWKQFCEKKGSKSEDVRMEYFRRITNLLVSLVHPIDFVVLAGFGMRIPETPFLEKFNYRVLNVHPGDFAVRTADGKVKYTGSHAVRRAILDGATEIRSTVHIVTADLDQGPAVLRSPPVYVRLPDGVSRDDLKADPALADKVAAEHQSRLKKVGDLMIYPKAVELVAEERVKKDEEGNLYIDDERVPIGGLDVRDVTG